jgi:phosphoribosylaminoimidazolecarboxamide formyltransferase/IMP cyclohydrolase
VHGGLLLNIEDSDHAEWMKENNVQSIDLVVSNLYPFEKIAEKDPTLKEAADNIDIGGPTLTRSAAKAALLYDKALIVTDPAQYPEVIEIIKRNNGKVTTELRRRYALAAFKRTYNYDKAIVKYLERD